MEIKCIFRYQKWYGTEAEYYTCRVTSVDINEPGTKVAAFKGTHVHGKRFKEVEALDFEDCNVKYFPREVYKIFPYLRALHVKNCGLMFIEREDLMGMQSLEHIFIMENQLKSVPSDLFVGMHCLKDISFYKNQITFSGSEVLKPVRNNGIKSVDLECNKNVSAYFLPNEPGSLPSLIELIKVLDSTSDEPDFTCASVKPFEVLAPKAVKPIDGTSNAHDIHDYSIKTEKSFAAAVGNLWESKKFADFTIIVGSETFRVHKFVLALQSAKFAEMFDQQEEVSKMNIEDLEVGVVEEFLRYIYTGGEIPQTVDFIKLYKLSDKLEVFDLKAHCEKVVLKSLKESNAYEILKLGHAHGSDELKKQALNTIRKTFPDCDLDDEYMENPENLQELIRAKKYFDTVKEKFKKAPIVP